ncbi:MAG: tetratricopeptide repeat protein [Kiritimatiellaeota bacterium]|nr:tetratricopeptide repeat protein [Kiritimatiellota bacterium]
MTRISFVFLCAVALVCGCGSRSGLSDAKKGMAAFKDGNHEKAIRYFTAATERITSSPELYYHLGLAYLAHGDVKDARDAFEAALNLSPVENEANILGGLAQAAYHLKDFKAALAALEHALAVSPDDGTAVRLLTAMGAVQASNQNYSLAHLYYLRALKMNFSHAPARYNLSVLYQDQYDLKEEAFDNFKLFMGTADAKDKKRDKVENRINRLRTNLDRMAAARPAPQRNATRAGVLLQEAVNAHIARQHSRAVKAYKDALEADPLTFSAAYGLASLYRQQGNRAEALETFKIAIDINPTHQDSYAKAADMALQLRQPDEAVRLLTKALARSPNNPETARLMAQAAAAKRNGLEAAAYGEFYLSLIPKDSPDRAEFEKWVNTLKKK